MKLERRKDQFLFDPSIKANIDKIKTLEKEMLKHDQVDIEVVHHFAPGLYAREMRVPKGIMLTGKIHKHRHLNIMSAGKALMVNEAGRHEVSAPFSFVSEEGTKRAFYALEDVVWTTLHPTDETDLDEIEREWIVDDYQDLLADQGDHELFLAEYSLTQQDADEVSENESDRQDVEIAGIECRQSPLHGVGVFATRYFLDGQEIGPALLNGKRTQVGRYANHSKSPNAEMVIRGNAVYCRAISNIAKGDEVLTDYRHTMNLRGIQP